MMEIEKSSVQEEMAQKEKISGQEILAAMNGIDDEIINESAETFTGQKTLHKHWGKWTAVAAVFVAMISGTIVMADSAKGLQTKKVHYMNGEVEIWDFNVEKVSMDELTGNIHEVKDLIREQVYNADPLSSWLPDHWMQSYSTPEDAAAYIGYDKLMLPGWDMEPVLTNINVYGNMVDWDFEYITLDIYYKTEDLYISTRAGIVTEHCENPLVYSHVLNDQEQYQNRLMIYETSTEQECTILIREFGSKERNSIEGYLVEENVIYWIQFGYPMEQEEEAIALVKEWVESLR